VQWGQLGQSQWRLMQAPVASNSTQVSSPKHQRKASVILYHYDIYGEYYGMADSIINI
jgi:hypothetical protein